MSHNICDTLLRHHIMVMAYSWQHRITHSTHLNWGRAHARNRNNSPIDPVKARPTRAESFSCKVCKSKMNIFLFTFYTRHVYCWNLFPFCKFNFLSSHRTAADISWPAGPVSTNRSGPLSEVDCDRPIRALPVFNNEPTANQKPPLLVTANHSSRRFWLSGSTAALVSFHRRILKVQHQVHK